MDKAATTVYTLRDRGQTLSTAESCTGGLLGKLLTDVPGASSVYAGGVISYAYSVKEQLLGVEPQLLEEKGAVCSEVACQMASGVRQLLKTDYALAVTGNAGPGVDPLNPNVGEIYVAIADAAGTSCRKLALMGNREENRMAACLAALELLPI